MKPNETNSQKTVVEQLSFGAKTAKCVTWGTWSFRIVGPLQVEVVNESYGYLRDEHTYTVAVEERDGIVVPAECECPADRYHEAHDYKHKVALATVGGRVVLNAARAFPLESEGGAKPITMVADKLTPDGGRVEAKAASPGARPSTTGSCPHGNDRCDGPDGDGLPCFACYQPDDSEEEA